MSPEASAYLPKTSIVDDKADFELNGYRQTYANIRKERFESVGVKH